MRFNLLAIVIAVLIAIAFCGDRPDVFAQDAGNNLIQQYREARGEIEKRDLALKLIDAGVLKKLKSTKSDVARIFGADWTPDFDVAKYESYGIVHFAKQPTGPNYVQVPYVGWYLVIHYGTRDKVIYSWELSDDHK